jgi:integrase
MARHEILGGKVHVYKRDETRQWHCSASINGRQLRTTTKQESLEQAKDFAEDWNLELRGKLKRGELKSGKTFSEAAERFLREYDVITRGQRSPHMLENYESKLRVHLLPFFGKKWMSEITSALIQDYRIHRHEAGKGRRGTMPTRSTMHKDMVALRQVLKSAVRNGWLDHMPDLSEPYRTSEKISHRAWFSPEEYKQFYEATRRRVEHPPKPRWKSSCEQAHDYVLFMANTGLRPDEAARLEFRDVSIVSDDATKQTILEIKVRGKRGTGYCKSTTRAVVPFNRLRGRNMKQPADRLFPKPIRMIFNAVLDEENLRFDREGNRRTPYSLRHTYICLRLMEGADIYQIAKNSVEMIEKYYASHIASSLDAAAINVRRPRKRKKAETQDDDEKE